MKERSQHWWITCSEVEFMTECTKLRIENDWSNDDVAEYLLRRNVISDGFMTKEQAE